MKVASRNKKGKNKGTYSINLAGVKKGKPRIGGRFKVYIDNGDDRGFTLIRKALAKLG